MKQKLQEIIARLDRIEQTVNLIIGAEKGKSIVTTPQIDLGELIEFKSEAETD